MSEFVEEPLGTCCQRLHDELNATYTDTFFFERDGLLAMTTGYREASGSMGAHWVRAFAQFCPFCGSPIMPEPAQRKN
jgi:hypothetical protein